MENEGNTSDAAATGPSALSDIDVERPSPARMYDYFLGGAHNFEADRRLAEQTIAAFPGVVVSAQANRSFLRRAVKFLADAGVRQFIDIGSGIPTVGHVHEIAQDSAPESRVVYVDIDPVAVAHSKQILAGNDRTAVIQQDTRQPEQIVNHPDVRRLIDFDQPVALLVVALFHFIPDSDDPAGIIRQFSASLCSGSYLVLSHLSEDGLDPALVARGKEIYRRAGVELTARTREQVMALFSGFDLVEPGLVQAAEWRPDSTTDSDVNAAIAPGYVGVGRIP